jgi:hypothetical protein
VPILDVFNGDIFSTVSLTQAIDKLPYVPARIGQMGLFRSRGIPTTTAVIEERHGKLSLIPTAARGTMPTALSGRDREARAFNIPHLPVNSAVMADDVQNVRSFGSENNLEAISSLVNDKMGMMKQDLETTLEYHRVGALHGKVLDADGATTVYNFFTEFGVTEVVVNIAFGTDSIKQKGLDITREIEDALGATPYTRIHAMCGNNYFDALINDPEVKDAFERYQNNAFARADPGQQRKGFEYAGIIWENYRGKVGSVDFFDTDQARFFPVGVPGLFDTIYAPAPFMETVNTIGRPMYAKQERMKFDVGVELHAETNPLVMCTRPKCLVKGTKS